MKAHLLYGSTVKLVQFNGKLADLHKTAKAQLGLEKSAKVYSLNEFLINSCKIAIKHANKGWEVTEDRMEDLEDEIFLRVTREGSSRKQLSELLISHGCRDRCYRTNCRHFSKHSTAPQLRSTRLYF